MKFKLFVKSWRVIFLVVFHAVLLLKAVPVALTRSKQLACRLWTHQLLVCRSWHQILKRKRVNATIEFESKFIQLLF